MKLNKSILSITILLVLVFFLAGCLPVSVTGVTILQDDFFQIVVGGTPFQLTIEIEPPNAANKAVTWTSSDPNVATVNENGLVTAVAGGIAIITVTTVVGGFTDSVELEVIYIY
jgi:uncharacterized protein YjdB